MMSNVDEFERELRELYQKYGVRHPSKTTIRIARQALYHSVTSDHSVRDEEIYIAHTQGVSQVSIAKQYNISANRVGQIIARKKRWLRHPSRQGLTS